MDRAKSILVTGGTGFIGAALTRSLLRGGASVRITGLVPDEGLASLGARWCPMPDLDGDTDWRPALEGVDAVVHLAGVAHRAKDDPYLSSDAYDRVNHRATRALARTLSESHVRRFVFVSSVAVHGKPRAFPLRADHPTAPTTPYGQSKLDAERAVREELSGSELSWAILRPVLVYGPGNPGNMARLERLIRRGIPIPVGRRPNRRSFLFVGNLVDALLRYLASDAPPTERTWIIADSEPHSTEALVDALGSAIGIRPRVLAVPDPLLVASARLGDLASAAGLPAPWTTEVREKLLDDFYVDTTELQNDLRWDPPFDLAAGLGLTTRP